MNSLFAILLKNITLAILTTFIVLYIIGYRQVDFLFLFSVLGIVYCLSACFEAYKLSQLKSTATKFVYFTDGFFTKRFIKVIAFVCCGTVLYYSESIIRYLAFLCFLIAFTEVVVTLLRYTKSLCFIAFDTNYFVISTNKLNSIASSSIIKIEERHGLLYVVNNQGISFTIRLDMMKKQEEFKLKLYSWIEEQNITNKVII